MRRTYRFENPGSSEITIFVEPWCDTIPVPPGSTLVLHCEGADEHPPSIAPNDGGIWFCPECDSYTAELDGEPFET